MNCIICDSEITGKSKKYCSLKHARVWYRRQYRQRNKEKINAYKRAYWKARKRVTGYFEAEVRPRFLKENNICLKCGTRDDLQVHHIKPLGLGGDNSSGNLMTLCRVHHRKFEELTKDFFKE